MDNTLIKVLQVYLATHGIEGTVHSPDGYPIVHCPKIGGMGVKVHMNFSIEDIEYDETENTTIEDLLPVLQTWGY